MIKAIVFDLYETLITESGAQPPGVSSFAPALGCDRDAFRREWKSVRPSVTLGRVSFRQAIADIAARLGVAVDAAVLDRLCAERTRIKAQPFAAIDEDVMAMLDAVRARGLRLAVISNCWEEHVAGWRPSTLPSRVECAVFSFAVGLAKPDEAIYREALRQLAVTPSQAWYIGDGADDELAGARRAGLRAFKAEWFLKRWPHYVASGAADVLAAPADLLARLPSNSRAG